MASGLLSTSCNDYLDVVPKGDVETIETNFEQRNDVDKWLKTCYAMFTNMATSYDEQPGFFGADEFVAGQYFRDNMAAYGPAIYIGDGLQMAQNPYCNIWSKDGAYCLIRYCNLFIDNVDLCQNMTKDEKTLWKAEIKALKASTYFELLKRYGSFILVPENIDANADKVAMQQPRASIDDCVNAIVSLCDEAIADLPTMSGSEESRHAYFKKESTAAVKAYALLFAASPLFNGNEQLKNFTNKNGERLFPVYDKEKWHKAAIAADEAINYALAGGKHLYNSTNDKGTDMLNTIFNIQQSVSMSFVHFTLTFSMIGSLLFVQFTISLSHPGDTVRLSHFPMYLISPSPAISAYVSLMSWQAVKEVMAARDIINVFIFFFMSYSSFLVQTSNSCNRK